MSAPERHQLGAVQRHQVERAREVLVASQTETDPGEYARHCGALEYWLEQILALVDGLTSEPGAEDDAGRAIAADLDERAWDGRGIGAEDLPGTDARMVAAIRAVLAEFDWERDDRQYALEAIEMIVDGGQAPAPAAGVCEHEAGPLAGMKGSEVARRYLDARGRDGLESLLLFISGYCPAAFLAAVAERMRIETSAEDDAGRAIAADDCSCAPYPSGADRDCPLHNSRCGCCGELRGECQCEWECGLTGHATAQDDAGRAIAADLGDRDDPPCPETSDGQHCTHYDDPADRSCCACGSVNWLIDDDEDGAS